jgi:hypothetical protein
MAAGLSNAGNTIVLSSGGITITANATNGAVSIVAPFGFGFTDGGGDFFNCSIFNAGCSLTLGSGNNFTVANTTESQGCFFDTGTIFVFECPEEGSTSQIQGNISASIIGFANEAPANVVATPADSNSPPTISSGFGTSPSIVNSNGTAAFQINVGTGGTASSGVLAFSTTAAHGWVVHCDDLTTQSTSVFLTKQTANSTTTATITNYNTAGAATAWVASDRLWCQARGD